MSSVRCVYQYTEKLNSLLSKFAINKCTRNERPFPFYRKERKRIFPDRHILIKRSLNIISQNKHSIALNLTIAHNLNKYKQNADKAIENFVL